MIINVKQLHRKTNPFQGWNLNELFPRMSRLFYINSYFEDNFRCN